MLTIREATLVDMDDLQELYRCHLAKTPTEPQDREKFQRTLQSITADGDYHLLVGELDGKIVSSVTLVIVKNLTHNARAYSIIENVVTHSDFRGQGHASALMARATEIAQAAGCYKIMLMTGSKLESTLRFYERCGFNREDKTGFIKWLKN